MNIDSAVGAARLLVVDDSRTIGTMVCRMMREETHLPVDYAQTLAECRAFLAEHREHYALAVIDLSLPDAPNGEAVDYVLAGNVPTIVLTGSVDEQTHARITVKPIVDYIVKQNPGALDGLRRDVHRIRRNPRCKVLIVDDDKTVRTHLHRLLTVQRLQVFEAEGGEGMRKAFAEHPDIQLVIMDYVMDHEDGVQLTAELRKHHPASSTAIIGLTAHDAAYVGVRFLKAGADDIIRKPFLTEEFISRINSRLDHIEDVRTIRDQAHRDYLTNLYNRRYLFEMGNTLYNSAKRGHVKLATAVVDIDHFKRINDTYGHDVGDEAIVALARTLERSFRESDLVARMGGEEFCVLIVNAEDPVAVCERLRRAIEAIAIPLSSGATLRMTGSIGVSAALGDSLDGMISAADKALYAAKEGGRNRVVSTY